MRGFIRLLNARKHLKTKKDEVANIEREFKQNGPFWFGELNSYTVTFNVSSKQFRFRVCFANVLLNKLFIVLCFSWFINMHISKS